MDEKFNVESSATIDELNDAIDRIWVELKESGALATRATEAGVDVDTLLSAPREAVIVLESRGAGLEPLTTAIIVSVATTLATSAASGLAKMSADIWSEIILPALRRKFGADSIKQDQ
ncbi:hypothetical protein [Gemmatimonas sp.]|jgi:hypothetical protein|uniref:hypothetical protein n=1 Tax=Gemmatimonas sp. TaxID=1962908 RepID=UPI0037C1556D